jgi:ABC-2 type transport system permease protein
MAYSQSRALWAITKASFKAIFSQPSALFFSLLFPIAFLLVFGAFSNKTVASFKIAFAPDSDTASVFYDSLMANPAVKIVRFSDTVLMNSELKKGNLTAIITIQKNDTANGITIVKLRSAEASGGAVYRLMELLDYQALKMELADANLKRDYQFISEIMPGKRYQYIDFILPGQLGFSVLFATLFGIAFVFFNLREQLVLKRIFASPVKKINILIGIGASRLFFQLLNVIVLILFGHFFLNFTLIHGALTFFEMLLFSVYMLFLLMGAGLIISSVAKNDTMIPLMINLFAFPQILLSGTFFSIDVFPQWMQRLCELLPLTQFNIGLRKISLEGLHLYDCWKEIGFLGIWIIVIHAIVIKIMKWE